ncbi:MAG: hypothetical protein KDD90_10505 [Sphingomonadaceae bacterium]|jgi:hypothetical protein|nr:hypothetical protein [Sphingomonadaceae bacterium]
MRLLRNWTPGKRLVLMLAIVLALSVRAIVPQGYMPGDDGDAAGGFSLSVRVCNASDPSGSDRVEVQIPRAPDENGQGGDHSDGQSHEPCAFSPLAHAAIGAEAPMLPVLAPQFTDHHAGVERAFLLGIQSRLRPPLRAPPHSA